MKIADDNPTALAAQLPSTQSPIAGRNGHPTLFQSFWMAGFESSCHINTHGKRLDMMAAVGHDAHAEDDYAMLRSVNIRTARDGIRWHLMDRGGMYDFSPWTPMVEAARRQGIQVIWDICHYGWPDDLDIFSAAFVDRFARFSRAASAHLRDTGDDPGYFAPVNEISFFAWAACRSLMFPYARSRDGELKRQLVRAAIAASEAIRDADPRARIVFPEPLIHIVPPRGKPDHAARAKQESQFEAWDMLSGRCCPELGGHPRYLDIIGVNYYAANQWEVPGGRKLRWDGKPRDPRWRPLHLMLLDLYRRYERPLFIAETSHYGVGRAAWLREIAREAAQARQRGVPLEGVCLYPILDRFDWNDRSHWHNSGLWDFARHRNGHYHRVLNTDYAAALRGSQDLLARHGCR